MIGDRLRKRLKHAASWRVRLWLLRPDTIGGRIRVRLKEAAIIQVRSWVFGPHVQLDAPSRVVKADQPTAALFRVVETEQGEGYPVTVGRYSSVHWNAYVFLGGKHDLDSVSSFHFHRWIPGIPGEFEQPLTNGPVVIGSDVWIAWEAAIMSGVTIGHGAVVAARSLVTKDVEPYEIVGGTPARHIGWRFEQPIREGLMRIRWWEWPMETVIERVDELQSHDVAGFVAKYDPGLGDQSR